jgi:transposase
MNIKSFESLVRTENTARWYLSGLCWKNYRRFCIRCNSYQIYRIVGKRLRCKRCKYTFHDFSGRWINKLRISCQDWLWIIKLFELEMSARKIAQQIDLSYPTVLKAVTLIRKAIVPTASMPLICSAVKSNWMKPISVVDEKATVAVVLSTKYRYLAF